MTNVLIASDSPDVVADVQAVLHEADYEVTAVATGEAVRPAALRSTPDIAILDFHMGNQGGMATCMDLRLEESGGRLPKIPVLLLMDRRPDVFLARRAGADGWVMKPLDPIRLRKAIRAVLAGGRYEDTSFQPAVTVSPAAFGSGRTG